MHTLTVQQEELVDKIPLFAYNAQVNAVYNEEIADLLQDEAGTLFKFDQYLSYSMRIAWNLQMVLIAFGAMNQLA
ncbi:MAG: hypothetical protein WBA16_02870 [Nonlabens sp.]